MFETRADVVAMFQGVGDVGLFTDTAVPGTFDREYVGTLDIAGTSPVFACAGERVSAASAKLYGGVCEKTITTGDTLTKITRHNGETDGPFTVRNIQPDGTGVVILVLEG